MFDVIWHRLTGLHADRRGNFALEFALALPILFLLMVGLLDLGRYSLQKSALLQGAREGAQYGILAPTDTTNISTTAQNATGLSGVTASTDVFCECATGVRLDVSSCGTACAGGTMPKKYVKVTTNRAFTSVLVPASATFSVGSWIGNWTPPTSVSADVTMIVP
jgi:Flp pilus assembly protein TadG